MLLTELRGLLVAIPRENPYDFNDSETGRQVSGVSRKCFVVQTTEAPPVVVKFRDDKVGAFELLRQQAQSAGGPVPVAMMVEAGTSVQFVQLVQEPAKAR